MLFDKQCLDIFKDVKMLRDEGRVAREIIAALIDDPSAKQGKSSHETIYQRIRGEQTSQTGQLELYKRNLEKIYQILMEERKDRLEERKQRDIRIVRLEIDNTKLNENLLKHSAGPRTGQASKELSMAREKNQTALEIITKLRKLSCLSFRKRKKHLDRLQELFG